jgi:protein TonB
VSSYQDPTSRLIGFGLVLLLHVGIVYALVNGLARRAIEVVRAPIETKIIEEAPRERIEQPPPPPPILSTPSLPFVPPPEIHIERPVPVQSTAPTVVTTIKPPSAPEPAAPVAPVKPDSVQIMPRLDPAQSREPDYPPASRRLGEQGSLILEVLVDPNGRVTDARVVQTSGFERLDQAALDGIKTNYRFHPGTVDGEKQPMWYRFKFTWKLK